MLYFKRLIQIPRLPEVGQDLVWCSGELVGAPLDGSGDAAEGPSGLVSSTGLALCLLQFLNPLQGCTNFLSLQSPPNFLRASALAEHVKPVVVIPEEAPEDEEPENLIEISTTSTTEPQVGAWGWDGGQAPVSWLSSAASVLPRSPRICLSKPSGRPTAFGMTGMGGPAGAGGCCHVGPTCPCPQGCTDREPEEGGGNAPCRDGED